MQWEKELHETFYGVLPLNPVSDSEVDSMVWKYDNSGSFSVKSFTMQVYKMIYGNIQVSSVVNNVWIE